MKNKGNDITGTYTYFQKQKWGQSAILMPRLVQRMGPWLKPIKGTRYNVIKQENKTLTDLINQLPDYAYLRQKIAPEITNLLAYHWTNFDLSVKYTYVISDLDTLSEDDLFKNLTSDRRNRIKKAQRRLTVDNNFSVEELHAFQRKALAKQGKTPFYDLAFLKRIWTAADGRNQGEITRTVDEEGNTHSAVYRIWDDNTSYHLISVYDPEIADEGSSALLTWDAVVRSRQHSKNYDFEGSMLQGIERFYRSFGAEQQPYYEVKKENSRLLKFINVIR